MSGSRDIEEDEKALQDLRTKHFVLIPSLSSAADSLSSLSSSASPACLSPLSFPHEMVAHSDESSDTLPMESFLSKLRQIVSPLQDPELLMELLIQRNAISVFFISSNPPSSSSRDLEWKTSLMGVKVPKKLTYGSAPPVVDTDRWCLHIHNTIEILRNQVANLEKDVLNAKGQVTELLRTRQRNRALLWLRKVKNIEKLLDERTRILSKMEEIQMNIHSASNSKMVLDAFRIGSQALSQLNKEISLDDVDRVMEDLEESFANQKEIDEAMSRPIDSVSMDEDVCEEELNELVREEEEAERERERGREREREREMERARDREKEMGKEEECDVTAQLERLSLGFPSVPREGERKGEREGERRETKNMAF